jgi:hypothetical protein
MPAHSAVGAPKGANANAKSLTSLGVELEKPTPAGDPVELAD